MQNCFRLGMIMLSTPKTKRFLISVVCRQHRHRQSFPIRPVDPSSSPSNKSPEGCQDNWNSLTDTQSYRFDVSISADSPSNETLNRGLLALLLLRQYEFPFGVYIVQFSIFNLHCLFSYRLRLFSNRFYICFMNWIYCQINFKSIMLLQCLCCGSRTNSMIVVM